MSSVNQPSVYGFASGGRFGIEIHKPSPQFGLSANRTAQGTWASSAVVSPAGMPRFRNPSLVSSELRSPVGRSGSLPSSTASSPDSSRVASPVDNSTSSKAHTLSMAVQLCRCQRPQSLIMCSTCGFTFNGRVRSPCTVHPGQIYLMDNESCPECGSTCLKEYTDAT